MGLLPFKRYDKRTITYLVDADTMDNYGNSDVKISLSYDSNNALNT